SLAAFWSAATCRRFQSADMSAHSKFPVDNFFLPGNFANGPSGLGALLRNFSSPIITGLRREFPVAPSRVNLQAHGCIRKTETGFAKESARSVAQAWCVLDARPVQPRDLRG